MKILSVIATLAFSASAAAQTAPDFLKLSAQGKVECANPDPIAKTCSSMDTYARRPDGVIETTATIAINPAPLITVTTTAPTEIMGNRQCGEMKRALVDTASVQIDGKPADPAMTARVRAAMGTAFAKAEVKRICAVYAPTSDGGYSEHAVIDGVEHPEDEQKVMFVPAGEYHIAGQLARQPQPATPQPATSK